MLRDMTHKHDSSVQSTLSYVKTFLEWTLTFQGKNESNTNYVEVVEYKKWIMGRNQRNGVQFSAMSRPTGIGITNKIPTVIG